MLRFICLFFIALMFYVPLSAQVSDSFPQRDSVPVALQIPVQNEWQILAGENMYLNFKGKPESIAVRVRNPKDSDALFYIILGVVIFFGIIRRVYSRYFHTLFRVFFNSSLRQSQLTDQLLQSKLPALFYNLLFLFTAGLYAYLLLNNSGNQTGLINWTLLGLCLAAVGIIYAGKYIVLSFSGWLTGYNDEADAYIFIVFLINKILGICLLPIVVITSFALPVLVQVVTSISLIFIALMLIFRFFRSYGVLQSKLRISSFHFLLYIIALEILPLLVIYQLVHVYLLKNL